MSESEGEASFESADEGGESPDSQAGATVLSVSKESKKLDADVSNITEKVSAVSVPRHASVPKEAKSTGGVDEVRESTPTRKAHRMADNKEAEALVPEDQTSEGKPVLDRMAGSTKPKNWGWGNISNWGSSVLTTASSSVQTFADSVGEGFQTVLDSVESGLGAPDPEIVAEEKRQREEKEAERRSRASDSSSAASSESGGPDTPVSDTSTPDTPTAPIQIQPAPQDKAEVVAQTEEGGSEAGAARAEGQDPAGGWFGGWGIGGITSAVQQTVKKTVKDTTHAFQETGKTIMTGSLDVLETIGKKTYDVLAEGDHGLKKTIKKTKEKPNLSQMLREAKDQAAEQSKQEEEFAETRKAHYGAQFDEFQGLVQLEALEMLSNQSEGRVQGLLGTLKGSQLDNIKKELITMKDIFELKDIDEEEEDDEKDHDFDRLMADYVGQVGLNLTPEKLIQVQEKTRKLLMDCRVELDDGTQKEPKELHQQAIQSLAEFTARSIELFHRVGQLILLEKNAPASSYKTKATSLASATRVLCTEIGISSSKFTQYLGTVANSIDNPVSVNPLITNVFLEASNSSTYIQDGFLLLLPVLQQGAIEAHQRQAPGT